MATYEVNVEDVEPMSRTYQYRKVMKPMLERKRRARINKCLDELKDLMVGALQSEGESITKLEKADVLELTVRHLRKLKQHHALTIPAQNHAHEKFRAGFGHCATEVRRFVQAVPGVDIHVSGRLMNHLGQWMNQLEKTSTTIAPKPMSPLSPSSSPSIISVSIPPRVYTPPASPEVKPSPQPVALNLKTAHSSSGGVIFTSKAYSAATLPPTVATSSSSVVMPIPTLPTSYVPVRSPSFGSVEAAKSTGIKVEVPQGSPVWRPWSA